MNGPHLIPPRSGTAFPLRAGQVLTVTDALGCQVADLLAFAADDVREVISNGRTFDYEETVRLTTGNRIWSNRSRVLLEIVEDTVGCHDFLLTPCSEATFRHFIPKARPTVVASAIWPRLSPLMGSSPMRSRSPSMCS